MLRNEQMGSGFWKNHFWLSTQEAFNKQDSNRTEMKELKVGVVRDKGERIGSKSE